LKKFNFKWNLPIVQRSIHLITSVGYSTLWIAYSLYQNKVTLPSQKNIITIDSNPLKIKKAITNFKDARVSEIIEIIEGNAMEVLKQLSNNINENSEDQSQYFDFIFLDADKEKFYQDFQILITQADQEHN
jgi:caffeoyl-CoA O-methyltransferase